MDAYGQYANSTSISATMLMQINAMGDGSSFVAASGIDYGADAPSSAPEPGPCASMLLGFAAIAVTQYLKNSRARIRRPEIAASLRACWSAGRAWPNGLPAATARLDHHCRAARVDHRIAHAKNICNTNAMIGAASMVMIPKLRKNALWFLQFACILAVVSVMGGLAIAYRLESQPPIEIRKISRPSMRCNDAMETFKQLSIDDPLRYSSLVSQICAE